MTKKSLRLFYIRLTNWEYWPFGIVYFPIFIYYFWLSIKARTFFFFSASNPSIETGGMLGESKYSILKNIPDDYKAKTIFIPFQTHYDIVINLIYENNIAFPLIVKPDIGERGTGVEKIRTEAVLKNYIINNKQNFLIQEYIDYPIELGVFYYRYPNSQFGNVSSVVRKEFLTVIGNAKATLGQLIQQNPRASFQFERLKHFFDYSYIPYLNESILLEPIGNHCRGTMFLDSTDIIDKQLNDVLDKISLQINGFYFGRYDLRCASIEDLKKGINIKIMELNGAGAEPAHIYQPGFSILNAWKVLLHHWSVLYEISILNHKKGIPYMRFSEAKLYFNKIQSLK